MKIILGWERRRRGKKKKRRGEKKEKKKSAWPGTPPLIGHLQRTTVCFFAFLSRPRDSSTKLLRSSPIYRGRARVCSLAIFFLSSLSLSVSFLSDPTNCNDAILARFQTSNRRRREIGLQGRRSVPRNFPP